MRNSLALLALAPVAALPFVHAGTMVTGRHLADPSHVAIDSIFAQYDHTNTPGCALGVYRDDRIVYARGYGMADLNQHVPIDPSTVFYIASTSKQFTAMSVALLAEDGKLSLDDPIRKWIPELPAYADRITIHNLLHHTSGVRDYLGLWAISGRSFADEVPQEVALDLIARQRALDFEPGSQYSYSNSGYLLLAELVQRVSGKSLRDFAAERIFVPLGMTSTQFHDDNTRIVDRRAEGYQPKGDGTFSIVRTSFALVGDGGLLTSVNDLLKWDANFYHNVLGRGGPALISQVTTPMAVPLAGGRPQRYAFGLMPGTYRGLSIVEHGGAFIGFRAQLLRVPSEHLSVAILCNDYTAAPEQMARRVVDRYLADKLAPAAVAASKTPAGGPARVDATTLDRWVGRYEAQPGLVARVERSGDSLKLLIAGSTLQLTALTDSSFATPAFAEPVVFSSGNGTPAILVEAIGMTSPSPRLAAAPTLTSAQRRAYAGRYTSAELDSWATLRVRGDALEARMRWGDWMALEPLTRDSFVAPAARVDFTRDRTGAIAGFKLSQVRTRGVVFDRVR